MASEGPKRAGDLVSALFSGEASKRLSETSVAARAWYAANGDRERAHTTGVWLRASGKRGVDPVLVVGVDSSLLALELGTNRDLYLSRLSWSGIAISDIRFTVSKRSEASEIARKAAKDKKPSLPELLPSEREMVESQTRDLPEGLRQSVSRAMCASLRRNRADHTRKP